MTDSGFDVAGILNKQHVTIWPFKIEQRPPHGWWLSKEGGEAMGTTEEKLTGMLQDFWEKEF